MKFRPLTLLWLCTFLCGFSLNSRSEVPQDVFRPIGKYMAKGDAKSLSAWFAPCLEISILDHSSQASRKQATLILDNFFAGNRPSMFGIMHKAGSGNFKYALCDLTASGEHFRVTIFVSCRDGESYRIQQLKIERNE